MKHVKRTNTMQARALRHSEARIKRLEEALRKIAALSPDLDEPDVEDYDDTESASLQGVAVGNWEAAHIAREALGLPPGKPFDEQHQEAHDDV